MITVKEIDTKIKELTEECKRIPDSQAKPKKRRIAFLRNVRLYIETNPRPEFIQSEIERLKTTISIIDDRFYEWIDGKSGSNLKNQWRSLNNYQHLKKQLRTLKFIA